MHENTFLIGLEAGRDALSFIRLTPTWSVLPELSMDDFQVTTTSKIWNNAPVTNDIFATPHDLHSTSKVPR